MKLICGLLIVSLLLVGCAGASYTRSQDGSVVAKEGTLILTYAPDGKTVVGESFIPNDPSNFITKILGSSTPGQSPADIIKLLQLLMPVAK